jgi:hypothetical protein
MQNITLMYLIVYYVSINALFFVFNCVIIVCIRI